MPIKHGMKRTPEYSTWTNLKTRCNNRNNRKYLSYGARGIKVCPEWNSSFENFYKDMGPKPGPDFSIDRINNNEGYSKDNCRWATKKQQGNNQRTNKLIEYKNEIKTLSLWAEELKIPMKRLWDRLYKYNWDVNKAFTKEVRRGKNRS